RPAGCTAGRGAYRMGEPVISGNKLSTSGIYEDWHKCADEARSVADPLKDEKSKQMMLLIPDDYERSDKRAPNREPRGRAIGLKRGNDGPSARAGQETNSRELAPGSG